MKGYNLFIILRHIFSGGGRGSVVLGDAIGLDRCRIGRTQRRVTNGASNHQIRANDDAVKEPDRPKASDH